MILFTNKKFYFQQLVSMIILTLFAGKVAAQCDYSDDFITLPAPTTTAFGISYLLTGTSTAGWVYTSVETVKGPDVGVTGSSSRNKYKAMNTGEQGLSFPGYATAGYKGSVLSPLLSNGCDSIHFHYSTRGAGAKRVFEFSIEKDGVAVWKDTLTETYATVGIRYEYGIGKIGVTGSCKLRITNITGTSGTGYGVDGIIWGLCIQKVSKITTPAFTVTGKTNSENVYSGSAKVAIACKTQGVSIYYTTDGTAPTTASTLYTDSINLTTTTRVKAIAAYGDLISDMADTLVTFADETPPTVPTDLTGTPSQTSIDLSWTASTDNIGVTGYNIYANGELQGTVIGTGYTLSGLTPATEYIVDVEALDAAGNKSVKASTTISTLSVTTNIKEIGDNKITIYPNPITDYVNVNTTGDTRAVITDLSGKTMISIMLSEGSNRINTSALPTGVYLLRAGSNVVKLVK
ncbi:MAG: chitobiase/beta-hexosaminidase C-terminal domain-containing protein [Bacteroidales bacterium]|nr:chitobiase/beta-hexosaminidase C-terminal domain-containing protein [Bacteroidales bacterium]